MDPLSALIAGGFSLAGGIMGSNAQKEANAINAQNAANNIKLQKEFATNAIQWKVADAQAAGIHPLYALGASTTSFSPVSVGAQPVNAMAGAMADMGQNVARAASALRSPEERVSAVAKVATGQQLASNNLDLEIKKTNLELLRARLANLTQPGQPPGSPFPVPENTKVEQRPPLMVFGKRWDTNPNTSPMKAWEDQYGDEGPIAWGMPLVIGANDAIYNARKLIPQQLSRWWLEQQRGVQERYGSWLINRERR